MARIAGVLHAERRASARYGIDLHVQYAWGGRVLDASTLDISRTGMRIQTEVDLGVRTLLVTYFRLPHQTTLHQVEAEVVWVAMSEQILGLYECGLRFVGAPPALAQSLQELFQRVAASEEVSDLPMAADHDVVEVSNAEPEGDVVDPLAGWSSHASPEALDAALAADTSQREVNRRAASQKLQEARKLMRSERLQGAVKLLREAADLTPDSADIFEALGEALYRSGDVTGAAGVFDRALQLRQQ